MQQQEKKGLAEWVAFLSQVEIPVLSHTARSLAELRLDEENLSARGVAQIIKSDPMMTVKLLRYLQQHKRRIQEHEVVQVKQALMMLGLEAFFKKVPARPLVEEVLSGKMEALICLLGVVHRSHRASAYAMDWAVRLNDLHFEEVRIAALLHDITELLMWCFAPADMLNIRALQKQDKTMRSHAVQEQVLGFPLSELQYALALEWSLPKLLITLMDNACADQQRVRNVILAVNLARHSADGWENAALADDYKNIGDMLKMPVEQVMAIVAEEKAVGSDVPG